MINPKVNKEIIYFPFFSSKIIKNRIKCVPFFESGTLREIEPKNKSTTKATESRI